MTADPSPPPAPETAAAGLQAGDGGPASLTYEQLVEELEATIDRMAAGQIGIEEATDLYERAGRLHALAAERLARIEARIARLTGVDP